MTKERVKIAADLRGIFFSGEKRWRNSTVGYAYEVFSPNGRGFFQAETLDGIYNYIMKFPRIRKERYYV